MNKPNRLHASILGAVALVAVAIQFPSAQQAGQQGRGAAPVNTSKTTKEELDRWMKELSNWGRWGKDDQRGAANLITPAKRKQAVALAREGRTISLAHDVPQEKAVDTPAFLDRALVTVAPGVAMDRYQYTGTYHGVIHSHLDAVD